MCIWIDLYENRIGRSGEPLGKYAVKFLSLLQKKKARIVITDILLKELQRFYTVEQVRGMFFIFITRDKDFKKLADITQTCTPEQFI